VTVKDRSILSGASVEDLKKVPAHRIAAARLVPSGAPEKLPAKLAPMLAEIGERPFNKPDWLWEPKLDGYRTLAFIAPDGEVTLRSRNGLDLSAQFPALVAELARQGPHGMVIDGEIVVLDAAGGPRSMRCRIARS
jgi:bifunctional non-homologous end joining protein LigD